MIIDVILDRMDGYYYGKEQARAIYDYATFFHMEELASALDGGNNEEVTEALCKYIDDNEYNPQVKEYIRSVEWVQE